ncbi:MAG TPA: DUF4185 domain-containing protein [Candidatus Sphingobacterium stercorigallinarum]|nr:DUF4185 domain-containing protein [Candidatus Sphingobacterium stercorigallinarum]
MDKVLRVYARKLLAIASICTWTSLSAQQLGRLDTNFTDLILPNTPTGISGADGALSIDLGGNRTLFIWGDSFLGELDKNRRREPSRFVLGNTATLWDGKTATSLYGGEFHDPQPFIVTETPDVSWYWPADGYLMENGRLVLFLSEYEKKENETGPFSFRYIGCDLVTLDTSNWEVLSRKPFLENDHPIHYGHGVWVSHPYVYIYGSKADNTNFHSELHLMRMELVAGLPAGRAEYWTGERWDANPKASGAISGIHTAVSEQFSIRELCGKIVLLNQDRYRVPGEIYLYQAENPEGPFEKEQLVYTVDEPGLQADSLFTYNAMLHPQIRRDEHILMSYNVNTFSETLSWKKGSVYRPRFIWVPLATLRSSPIYQVK